jgi:hypothetical protein
MSGEDPTQLGTVDRVQDLMNAFSNVSVMGDPRRSSMSSYLTLRSESKVHYTRGLYHPSSVEFNLLGAEKANRLKRTGDRSPMDLSRIRYFGKAKLCGLLNCAGILPPWKQGPFDMASPERRNPIASGVHPYRGIAPILPY